MITEHNIVWEQIREATLSEDAKIRARQEKDVKWDK